jgi:hypothetical protein
VLGAFSGQLCNAVFKKVRINLVSKVLRVQAS